MLDPTSMHLPNAVLKIADGCKASRCQLVLMCAATPRIYYSRGSEHRQHIMQLSMSCKKYNLTLHRPTTRRHSRGPRHPADSTPLQLSCLR